MDIQQLIDSPESNLIERKRDTSGKFRYHFLSTVCAFANNFNAQDKSGYFMIGVADNGKLSGYVDSEGKDEERIRNWLADWVISPIPTFEISRHELAGGQVMVIRVESCDSICWFEKNAWVRIGAATHKANVQQLKELNALKHNQHFDGSVVSRADFESLDLPLFSAYQRALIAGEFIEANNRTPREQLAHQGFYHLKQDKPTVAGVLFCGAQPQDFLPMAYVSFMHVEGKYGLNREQIIDATEIKGDLQTQERIWTAKLSAVVKTQYLTMSNYKQHKQLNYPLEAVRELMFNAIMHRDYALQSPIRLYCYTDRIEIQSPGALFPPANENNFPKVSSYRNTTIAATMKKLGWVEQFGSGVEMAKKRLELNGNPEPEFEYGDTYFLARIYARG